MAHTARTTADSRRAPRGGDLERAFAQYNGELLGTLYHTTGNIEDARDALQEAFVKAWKHRHEVPQVANLKAWIFRIALNTARDMRQTAWRRKRESLPEGELMPATAQLSPEAVAEDRETIARLRSAIGQLRDEEREVFLLRQNGDLTYDEIGESLGIPTGTAKTRMRLAIEKLRVALGEV